MWDLGFGFRNSGFGIWDLGFRIQVSGFRFQVSGFRFRIAGFRLQVSGFGLEVSDFGLRDPPRTFEGLLFERQGQIPALKSLYVTYSLDSGMVLALPYMRTFRWAERGRFPV